MCRPHLTQEIRSLHLGRLRALIHQAIGPEMYVLLLFSSPVLCENK